MEEQKKGTSGQFRSSLDDPREKERIRAQILKDFPVGTEVVYARDDENLKRDLRGRVISVEMPNTDMRTTDVVMVLFEGEIKPEAMKTKDIKKFYPDPEGRATLRMCLELREPQ